MKLGRVVIQYRSGIMIASLLIAALSVRQASSLRVDSNFQSFFRERDPIRQAAEAINHHFGIMSFNVVIDSEEKDTMKQWDTLHRLKDFQLYIDSLPGVHKTVSFVDYCLLIDQGVQEGGGGIEVSAEGEVIESAPATPAKHKTFLDDPEQLKGVMQLLAGRPASFALVVNPDFSRTNIVVRSSSDFAAMVGKIQEFAQAHFPPD